MHTLFSHKYLFSTNLTHHSPHTNMRSLDSLATPRSGDNISRVKSSAIPVRIAHSVQGELSKCLDAAPYQSLTFRQWLNVYRIGIGISPAKEDHCHPYTLGNMSRSKRDHKHTNVGRVLSANIWRLPFALGRSLYFYLMLIVCCAWPVSRSRANESETLSKPNVQQPISLDDRNTFLILARLSGEFVMVCHLRVCMCFLLGSIGFIFSLPLRIASQSIVELFFFEGNQFSGTVSSTNTTRSST